MREIRPKVVVFPKDNNPYQELLYKDIQVEYRYLGNLTKSKTLNHLMMPFLLIYLRFKGFNVFHLHWAFGFIFPFKGYIGYLTSTIFYFFTISLIKFMGFKLVWTVHNILPHNRLFLDDLTARKFLIKMADKVIIHTSSTIQEFNELGLDSSKCVEIPMGSFLNVYENKVDKQEARKVLSIQQPKFLFLFFGKVDKYKGIEYLIKSFQKLNDTNTLLYIVGTGDDTYTNDRIIRVNRYVTDNEIQYYMNSADIVVFPFEKVTTSSSLILATSFGRPVIYPNLNSLSHLPTNIGYKYNPGQLMNALKMAISSKILDRKGETALKYSQSLDWSETSSKTKKLYQSLV